MEKEVSMDLFSRQRLRECQDLWSSDRRWAWGERRVGGGVPNPGF